MRKFVNQNDPRQGEYQPGLPFNKKNDREVIQLFKSLKQLLLTN